MEREDNEWNFRVVEDFEQQNLISVLFREVLC